MSDNSNFNYNNSQNFCSEKLHTNEIYSSNPQNDTANNPNLTTYNNYITPNQPNNLINQNYNLNPYKDYNSNPSYQNDQNYNVNNYQLQQYYNEPKFIDNRGNVKTNIIERSREVSDLEESLEFTGNIRHYYLKYIDKNPDLIPISFRRKIDFLNKMNLIIPVGCCFNMIMAYVNYMEVNRQFAMKHFFFSVMLTVASVYYSKIFIKQYQINSYNDLLSRYSENQIKEMVDKTIIINRNL